MSRQRRERQAARISGPQSARRPLFRAIETLLWVLVAGLFLWRVAPQVQAAVGWGSAGTVAPAVTFDMLDGSALPLRELKGQVVLVNFWATWCPPCRAEMPGFQKVYDARRGAGFTVLGVSTDEGSRQQVASFLRDHAIRYPVAVASSAVVAGFGGVSSLPTSFLIDRQGRVRYTVRGIFAEVTLRAAIDRLLAEGR
jgi:cytochrome c biogenesis protein CcmG/thiol:disulfide interchange protein DsbE